MAIPRFDAIFSAAVEGMQNAADLLRYLRDTTGDLQTSVIWDRLPQAMARAKATAVAALQECAKAPSAADLALPRYPGAPQTVATFTAAVIAVEVSAQVWNADLSAWLSGLTLADLVALKGVDLGAGKVAQFVWVDGFTAAQVAPLRQSAGLASLIAAFEAAGATA
ncbi:MAG: hypothetical protein ACOH2H_16265 [Cypionkella sp.]